MINFDLKDFRLASKADKYATRRTAIVLIHLLHDIPTVASLINVTDRTVRNWIVRFADGGFGALKDRPRIGRPPKFGPEILQWILQTVTNSNPTQFRFEFAYWTADRVRQAVFERFGVQASVWTVRRAMTRLGLTPQKPKFRSYYRAERDVKRWLSETFPKLKQKAEANGDTIVFADEAGMAADYHVGRTWGRRGETPVLRDAGRKFRVNMIGAIDAAGGMNFSTHVGSTTAETFVAFLKQLLDERSGRIHVVVDNLSIHTAARVTRFLKADGVKGRMEIHYLPTYSPDLNPIEMMWAHTKREVGQKIFKTMDEMHALIIRALKALKTAPELIKSFFRCKECCYTIA